MYFIILATYLCAFLLYICIQIFSQNRVPLLYAGSLYKIFISYFIKQLLTGEFFYYRDRYFGRKKIRGRRKKAVCPQYPLRHLICRRRYRGIAVIFLQSLTLCICLLWICFASCLNSYKDSALISFTLPRSTNSAQTWIFTFALPSFPSFDKSSRTARAPSSCLYTCTVDNGGSETSP